MKFIGDLGRGVGERLLVALSLSVVCRDWKAGNKRQVSTKWLEVRNVENGGWNSAGWSVRHYPKAACQGSDVGGEAELPSLGTGSCANRDDSRL